MNNFKSPKNGDNTVKNLNLTWKCLIPLKGLYVKFIIIIHKQKQRNDGGSPIMALLWPKYCSNIEKLINCMELLKQPQKNSGSIKNKTNELKFKQTKCTKTTPNVVFKVN